MQYIIADINWLSYEDGGRKQLPKQGSLYCPHIILDDPKSTQPWSISFKVSQVRDNGVSTILFSMLVDNDEAQQFVLCLSTGMRFRLLEGKKVVANGVIKGKTEEQCVLNM